nr:MAG TPA: hypothetical protein [Caudoviricetes sp.]
MIFTTITPVGSHLNTLEWALTARRKARRYFYAH